MTNPSPADRTEPRDLRPATGQQLVAKQTELATPDGPWPGVDARPALLPFYVYELRDPRDNKVFYVGKGRDQRIYAHGPGDGADKDRRIAEIENAGLQVSRIIVGRFETEVEAFAVESVLIKWVYGFANLTNVVHGHREKFVREWEDKARTEPRVIPGIDVERPLPGLRNGHFTAEQREKIARHGIVEKLDALRVALANAEPLRGLSFSDVDLSRASDPGIRVTGFSPCVRMNVDMQLTGDRVKVGLVPMGPDHLEAFDRALTSIPDPFPIKNASSTGRYAHTADFVSKDGGWRRGIPYESTDVIIAHIARTLARLNGALRLKAGG